MVVPIRYSHRPGDATKLSPFHDGIKIMSTIYRLARVNNPMFYFGMMGVFTTILGILTGVYVLLEWFQSYRSYPPYHPDRAPHRCRDRDFHVRDDQRHAAGLPP